MRMLALIADFLNCIQSTRITNFILEVAHPATAQASWGRCDEKHELRYDHRAIQGPH